MLKRIREWWLMLRLKRYLRKKVDKYFEDLLEKVESDWEAEIEKRFYRWQAYAKKKKKERNAPPPD